jgi:DNA-binding transcriptional regulator YhcF (GntR family)
VIVAIDPESLLPPYEQLRAQITELVAAGTLPAGARLPAVRQLAADLGVAPGTVARAYRELEHQGVLRARGRHGSFVTESPPRITHIDRTRQLASAASNFAATAQRLGLSKRDALAQVRRALEAQS